MKRFSMPADFKIDTLDQYAELNQKYKDSQIFETYGQITINNHIGSGRAYDLLPKVDLEMLKSYIAYSITKRIGFNYTLNSICMSNQEFSQEGIRSMVVFLHALYNAGVRSLTVALPSIMEIILMTNLDFEIKASTICQITNANKASSYKKLGIKRIVLDESINRDFDVLKRIRNTVGPNTEIIVNVICHKNCIYEVFHHNQTSHDIGIDSSQPSISYYSHLCMQQRCSSPSNILKMAWIRPEDLKYYLDIGINTFKLQGRQAVIKGNPIKAVTHYINETYDGNLIELLDLFSPTNSFIPNVNNKNLDGFIYPFFVNPGFCKNDCDSCGYCDNFANKKLPWGEINETFDMAHNFYKSYDQFRNLVKECIISQEKEIINDSYHSFNNKMNIM